MALIGFSTGALAKGDFRRGLELVRDAGTNVVELSALREMELPGLIAALPGLNLDHFQYVSIHAPSRFDRLPEKEAIELLKQAAEQNISIVLHPDCSSDLRLWEVFGRLLLIENMDKRKHTGRSVGELSQAFDCLPDARLCFDIAHARQVDPTMSQASMILRRFNDRIGQVHLSEVDSAGRHTRLTVSSQFAYPRILPLIPADVPVIIESSLEEQEIVPELEFARRLWAETGTMIRRTAF